MAKFTIRIELLDNPVSSDYDRLDAEMQNCYFVKTITADDGIAYRLPSGEYNMEGNYTIDRVLALARLACSTAEKGCIILVSETDARVWYNLRTVNE